MLRENAYSSHAIFPRSDVQFPNEHLLDSMEKQAQEQRAQGLQAQGLRAQWLQAQEQRAQGLQAQGSSLALRSLTLLKRKHPLEIARQE